MHSYQKTIDEMQFVLQNDIVEVNDDVQALATQYDAMCREVNERLRRCGEFLRRELWSEAIQFAEHEPDLLDVVGIVDFPERDEWVAFLAQNGVKTPEPLLSEIAEQLNEAYATEAPMQKLMAQHRTLALSLAPLPRRLSVMRQIRELDPMCSFWEEDIRTFERVRLQEIVAAADKAAKRRDAKRLRELSGELRETPWLIQPNKKVWALVDQQGKEAFQSRALDHLAEIGNELNDAFQALDLGQARRLRSQWSQLAEQIELSNEDPLYEGIGPVLDWIADEDEREEKERAFNNAVGRLERALAGRAQLEELEQMADAIQRSGHAMPEVLSTRYGNRVLALKVAQTRRRRGLIGAGIVGLLLTIALVAATIHQQNVSAHAQTVTETFRKLINDGHIEQARHLLDREAEFASSDEGMECETELADLEKAERERLAAFNQHIESARQDMDYVTASAALRRADTLARSKAEKAAVAELMAEVEKMHRVDVKKAETTFRDSISKASESISRLEDASLAQKPVGYLLKDAKRRIVTAKVAGVGLRPALLNELRLLESRLNAVEKRQTLEEDKQEMLTGLTKKALFVMTGPSAVSATKTYIEALKSFVEQFPDDVRAVGFKRALDESPFWLNAAEWHQKRGQWRSPKPDGKSTIAERLQLIAPLLATQVPIVDKPQIAEYRAYLDALGRRENVVKSDDGKPVLDGLSKLFADPLVSNVQTLKSKDGAMYFFSDAVDFEGKNQRSFKHLVGYLGETRSKIFLIKDFTNIKSSDAPQVSLATEIRRKMAVLKPADWGDFFLSSANSIQRAYDVDPILRLILLKRLLETASRGSYPLAKVLSPRIQKLENSGLDLGVPWMDPERQGRDGQERLAKDILSTFDDLDDVWKKAESWESQYRDRFSEKWLSIGWLDQDQDRLWRCRTNFDTDGNYLLYVIALTNDRKTYGWARIGTVVNGTTSLLTSESTLLVQGRPVIAVPFKKNPQVDKQ